MSSATHVCANEPQLIRLHKKLQSSKVNMLGTFRMQDIVKASAIVVCHG
jgi:hypothetical protein